MTVLSAGQKVTFASNNGGGNPPREYCVMAPSSATKIRVSVAGGTCAPRACIGDDVEVYLKKGAQPDPFDPDAGTKTLSYTPDASGGAFLVTNAAPGPWYIATIDGQNTLGYKNVTISVTFE